MNDRPFSSTVVCDMIGQLTAVIVGSAGFVLGGAASYLQLRHRAGWAPVVLRMAVPMALAINVGFIASEIDRHGVLPAMRQHFDSTLVLASLIGLAGMATHLVKRLRGVDGFLFVLAGLAQLGSLTALGKGEMAVTARPWFVSHGLAFALGGTCFAAGGAAGVAYLLVYRMLHGKRAPALVGRVASLEALERFCRWMAVIGLPLFTYGILTGLCGVWHRGDLGGTAWYLDMGFVASLAVWGLYAYLAYGLMYRARFRGRRAAKLATLGLALVVMAFVLKEVWSPMHK